MKLEDIAKNFYQKMSHIEMEHILIKEVIKNEVENINNQINNHKKLDEDIKELVGKSFHNLTFHHLKDGIIRFYDQKELDYQARYDSLILHKNKQYQWILANAYEEFEDFLETIYAYMGYKSNETWLLSDFGNITFNEIKEKDFLWFLSRAKNKKNIPQSILERLRILFSELSQVEKNNAANIDLKLMLTLIESLRHIIVHKNGYVDDKTEFINNILKKSGLYNNGKYKNEHKNLILQYFGTKDYENLIRLLEIVNRPHPNVALEFTHDVLGGLIGYLIGYSTCILEQLCIKFNEELNILELPKMK